MLSVTRFGEALEDQGWANLAGAGGDALALGVSAEDRVLLRETPQRLHERIQTAGGRQLIQPAEAVQNVTLRFRAAAASSQQLQQVAPAFPHRVSEIGQTGTVNQALDLLLL